MNPVRCTWRWLMRMVAKVCRFALGEVPVAPAAPQPPPRSEDTVVTLSPIKTLRHFSRVPFEAKVQLHLESRVLNVQLIDIALKGALVQTDSAQLLVPLAKCRLELHLTNGGDSIIMVGQIAHLGVQHVGIECLDIDVLSLMRLRRLIELNTGDANLPDRELGRLFANG